MQKAQAVLTLFGVPDAVGHTEGKMFATFGGLQVFLDAAGPIEVGPMKIEARLNAGVWVANDAALVACPNLPAVERLAPSPSEPLKLVVDTPAPAAEVVPPLAVVPAEAVSVAAIQPAPISPELATVPLVAVERSAFANVERSAKPAEVQVAKDKSIKPVAAVAPVASAAAKPAPAVAVASGGAFSGLTRNRGSMPSQVSRPSSTVVPIKVASGVAVAARPRFDPNDQSLKSSDVPF